MSLRAASPLRLVPSCAVVTPAVWARAGTGTNVLGASSPVESRSSGVCAANEERLDARASLRDLWQACCRPIWRSTVISRCITARGTPGGRHAARETRRSRHLPLRLLRPAFDRHDALLTPSSVVTSPSAKGAPRRSRPARPSCRRANAAAAAAASRTRPDARLTPSRFGRRGRRPRIFRPSRRRLIHRSPDRVAAAPSALVESASPDAERSWSTTLLDPLRRRPPPFRRSSAPCSRSGRSRAASIVQPYHTEVGAGTFNPATFLRCLDARPWRAAYVEPSIRPDRRPLRREPLPAAATTTSTRSSSSRRRATSRTSTCARWWPSGIDPRRPRHPLRRRQLGGPDAGRLGPGLGGLGRRHGDHPVHLLPAARRLRPRPDHRSRSPTASSASPCTCRASTRSTTSSGRAGPKRTGARSWSPTATSTERTSASSRPTTSRSPTPTLLLQHFKDYEAEARRCLAAGLPMPAYDYVLKCSHMFNLLDARGVISVTDRTAYIAACP